MNCCSTMDIQSFCRDFNCRVEETAQGIRIEVSPKDASKAEALKTFVKAARDLGLCTC